MFSRIPFNLSGATPHIPLWRRKNNTQIVAAKAVHGQAKGLGGATTQAATLRSLFVAPLLKNSLKRQNEKRELGSTGADDN
jgi:hypothetical protein